MFGTELYGTDQHDIFFSLDSFLVNREKVEEKEGEKERMKEKRKNEMYKEREEHE